MDAAEALEAELVHALVDHGGEGVVVAHVIAAREHVAGVEADADLLVAAGALDDVVELGERATQRANGARGVLEQEACVLRLREHLADHVGHASQRRLQRLLQP